jgi:hypothetical protein
MYLRETPIAPNEKPEAVEARVEADLTGLPRLVGVIDLVRPGGRIVGFLKQFGKQLKKSRDTGSSMERLLETHSMHSTSSKSKASIFADQPTSRGLLF